MRKGREREKHTEQGMSIFPFWYTEKNATRAWLSFHPTDPTLLSLYTTTNIQTHTQAHTYIFYLTFLVLSLTLPTVTLCVLFENS